MLNAQKYLIKVGSLLSNNEPENGKIGEKVNT